MPRPPCPPSPPFALPSLLVAALALSPRAQDAGAAPSLPPLRVAFVGDLASGRGQDLVRFLRESFGRVDAVDVADCEPSRLRTAHVVVLDWPDAGAAPQQPDPLGELERLDRPVVLLGTTGRRIARRWELPGAAGAPLAGDVAIADASHPLFAHRNRVLAPQGTLALAADGETARNGWCADVRSLAGPEIEVLCTAPAPPLAHGAAVWRQGNLLHWGLAASPGECTAAGRALLQNAIAYAARFVVDRPVVHAGTAPAWRLHALLDDPATDAAALAAAFAAPWRERIERVGGSAQAFVRERLGALREQDGAFAFDAAALQLGVDLRDAGVLRPLAELLRGERRDVALPLLLRLLHDVPGAPDAATTVNNWVDFLEPREAALCFDAHVHAFRLDPLAHWRGVATASLRGAARADGDTVRDPAAAELAARIAAHHGGDRAMADLRTFACRRGDVCYFLDRLHGILRIENHGSLPPGNFGTAWQLVVFDVAADVDLVRGGGPAPRPFVSGRGMYRELVEELFLPLRLLDPGTSLRRLPDEAGHARLQVRLAGRALDLRREHVLVVDETGALLAVDVVERGRTTRHRVEATQRVGPLVLPAHQVEQGRRPHHREWTDMRWNPPVPDGLAEATSERLLR